LELLKRKNHGVVGYKGVDRSFDGCILHDAVSLID